MNKLDLVKQILEIEAIQKERIKKNRLLTYNSGEKKTFKTNRIP